MFFPIMVKSFCDNQINKKLSFSSPLSKARNTNLLLDIIPAPSLWAYFYLQHILHDQRQHMHSADHEMQDHSLSHSQVYMSGHHLVCTQI